MSSEAIPIRLTEKQFKKLHNLQPVRLSGGALGASDAMHSIAFHPVQRKKVLKAMKAGKGCTVHLSPHEIEQSGDGFKEWVREAARKVGKFYNENLKPIVAPLLKQGVGKLVDIGAQTVGKRIPGVGAFLEGNKEAISEKIGKMTGAYGLHCPKCRVALAGGDLVMLGKVPKAKTILPPPGLPQSSKYTSGGSFRSAGGNVMTL